MSTSRADFRNRHTEAMKKKPSDTALLESALATIERVLARADSDLRGTPYFGPTDNVALEALELPRLAEDERFRASAAQSAVNICLGSAAALVDVSKTLMHRPANHAAPELDREWKALIAYTKMASRSAYRAALILSAQKNVLSAQGRATAEETLRYSAH
jgi:hypothetical protein